MIDRKEFRRKFLLRTVSNPVSVVPFVGGLTILFGMWVFGEMSVAVAFVAAVAILAGIGLAVSRFILQTDAIAKDVVAEIEKEQVAARERRLDELDARLRQDGDPRTETLLHDLRVMMGAFREDRSWTEERGGVSGSLDILSKMDQLAEGCINALEQSLVISRRRSQLSSKEVRKAFDERYEKVIGEVQGSLVRLGDMHGKIQQLTLSGNDPTTALKELRADLDNNLRIAEKVEQRMRGFTEHDDDGAEYEKFASP